MTNPDEHSITPFSKPVEIKLTDVLFFTMKKNLMLFKDLDCKHIHYSIFVDGSLVDFHKTLEDQGRHIPLAKVEFDWQSLMQRIDREIKANWRSIFRTVKIDDPEWEDFEIEFIPVPVLMELLSPAMKGVRLNIDVKFAEKLGGSLSYSRLGELAGRGWVIGTGSGYLAISNGAECILFHTGEMSKIFDKSLEASIRKIQLSHFTPRSVFWYLRIRLLILINSAISHLKKLKP